MKILPVLLIFLSLTTGNAMASTRDTSLAPANFLKSMSHIGFIKKHGILIRLQTNDLAVKALRDRGNNKRADQLIADQKTKDAVILESFKKYFSFCPVYYFSSRDYSSIQKGDYSKVYNLDGSAANYQGSMVFIVDPYLVPNNFTNGLNEGISLYDHSNNQASFPMPSGIVKRRGLFYRTYDQMVWDWNQDFRAMDEFSKVIESRISSGTSKSTLRELKAERQRLFKSYRKDNQTRPKPVNSGR